MSILNAIDLIHTVPEVEKRLVDDMSRQIYNICIDHAIYRDIEKFRENIANLNIKWRYRPDLENFFTKNNPKRIIIFGSGEWGRQTLRTLRHSKYKNLAVSFCDNDKNKWHTNIVDGIDIISPEEAIKLEESVIIIGSIIYENELYQQIINMGYPKERVCMPLRAISGWQYFDYFEPKENEIFVDGGSANAGTAVEFKRWANKGYDYIYSFEANPNSIKVCENNFKKHELKGQVIAKGLWDERAVLHFNVHENSGASSIMESGSEIIETISLDEVLNGNKVTFIKMDIEGAEYKALLGAEKTIKTWHPRMAICVYHKPEDILEIPALILSIQPDYKFALRQYLAHGTETVLYAY